MKIPNESPHAAAVDLWVLQVTKNLSAPELGNAFERALMALWKRTHTALGDVTLWAIADRVIFTATRKYPSLASLKVGENGFYFQKAPEPAKQVHESELLEAARCVLVDFLTIIGNLTGDILTPAMHEELARLSGEEAGHKVSSDTKAPVELTEDDDRSKAKKS